MLTELKNKRTKKTQRAFSPSKSEVLETLVNVYVCIWCNVLLVAHLPCDHRWRDS